MIQARQGNSAIAGSAPPGEQTPPAGADPTQSPIWDPRFQVPITISAQGGTPSHVITIATATVAGEFNGRQYAVGETITLNDGLPDLTTTASTTAAAAGPATTTSNGLTSTDESSSRSTAAITSTPASTATAIESFIRTHFSFDIVTSGSDGLMHHAADPYTIPVTNTNGSTVSLRLYTRRPENTAAIALKRREAVLSAYPNGAFAQIEPFQAIKSGNSGLSSGVGAGIGIGCAILGGLLAFAVFFCFFRRKTPARSRSRHNSKSPSRYQDNAYKMETKAPSAITTLAIPHDSAAATVFNNIPQPKEDAFISDEFSRVKSRIDGHVNTYYLRSGGNEKASLDAFAHIWAAQSLIPLGRLPSLLADSRSRSHILRAAIAWVISRRILPNGPLNESFLPAEIAASYAALANNRMDPNSKLNAPAQMKSTLNFKMHEALTTPLSTARSAFLSEWRVLTAHLSSQLYGTESFSPEDSRLTSIQSALRQADMFLAPLASSADHEARLRNLEEIMKRAARFGWTLFSQPSEYEVDWTDDGRGVVVFPGLVQVSDENGRRLRQARSFGQKEVVPI